MVLTAGGVSRTDIRIQGLAQPKKALELEGGRLQLVEHRRLMLQYHEGDDVAGGLQVASDVDLAFQSFELGWTAGFGSSHPHSPAN